MIAMDLKAIWDNVGYVLFSAAAAPVKLGVRRPGGTDE
jgi:hypothetical protein